MSDPARDDDLSVADAPWPFLRKNCSGERQARILGDNGREDAAAV